MHYFFSGPTKRPRRDRRISTTTETPWSEEEESSEVTEKPSESRRRNTNAVRVSNAANINNEVIPLFHKLLPRIQFLILVPLF